MTDTSQHLLLPFIQAGQAQKHVTHNEAIRTLDALVQLSVKDRTGTPDPAPDAGARYVIAAGATGIWTDRDGDIALWEDNAWRYFTPRPGWTAWDETAGKLLAFDGAGWTDAAAAGGTPGNTTDLWGVNTTADAVNRLSLASDATLLSHDANGGHQLKINKAATADTASLLFQTAWQGRAEMGTVGGDDFSIKVSPDGSTFHTAIAVDHTTGAVTFPNTALSDPAFGDGPFITQDYSIAKGADLVANSTGFLGNGYNYPAGFGFDPSNTPNMPGAFYKDGYYSGVDEMQEFIAVDPNRAYRLTSYICQESAAGDWSAFPNQERHLHYMGLQMYDVDGHLINVAHHARYKHGGTDSLTTLTQPLAPGDTAVHVADASGWNETETLILRRGIIIFEYKNSFGKKYDHYSRIVQGDLFNAGDIDKTAGVVTLNRAFPASMGNPDDPAGVWPVGTRIANANTGSTYKYSFYASLIPATTDTWYRVENFIGGIDYSGEDTARNFPPGTAKVRPMWLANYSKRAGGFSSYPDTGTAHRVLFTGVSLAAEPIQSVTREANGSCTLQVLTADATTGALSLAPPAQSITEV